MKKKTKYIKGLSTAERGVLFKAWRGAWERQDFTVQPGTEEHKEYLILAQLGNRLSHGLSSNNTFLKFSGWGRIRL